MQALTIALLLALAAAAETAEDRAARVIAGLPARQPAELVPLASDPCAAAREIARQPPCLAGGDCRALELWRQSFGSPRVEPLEPGPAATRSLEDHRWPVTPLPGPRRSLAPGFVCPAGPPR